MQVYHAQLSAGSLMPLESRRIATLLLTQPDQTAWHEAIVTHNILQKNTASSATRMARLIRARLVGFDAEAWTLITTRENEVCLQLLLAASVKHSHLLGDFLRRVYADRQRGLDLALSPLDWQDFLEECAHRDQTVLQWTPSTRAKLFQVIVRILSEARFLDNTHTMQLTPQSLHPVVKRYLHEHDEAYVLECLERAPCI